MNQMMLLHPIFFVSELTALSKTHSMLEEEDKGVHKVL